MELAVVDDRTDLFPQHYGDNPVYWKNFMDFYLISEIDKFTDVLKKEYNVTSISKCNVIINRCTYREIKFKTREDLVYFKLRWS